MMSQCAYCSGEETTAVGTFNHKPGCRMLASFGTHIAEAVQIFKPQAAPSEPQAGPRLQAIGKLIRKYERAVRDDTDDHHESGFDKDDRPAMLAAETELWEAIQALTVPASPGDGAQEAVVELHTALERAWKVADDLGQDADYIIASYRGFERRIDSTILYELVCAVQDARSALAALETPAGDGARNYWRDNYAALCDAVEEHLGDFLPENYLEDEADGLPAMVETVKEAASWLRAERAGRTGETTVGAEPGAGSSILPASSVGRAPEHANAASGRPVSSSPAGDGAPALREQLSGELDWLEREANAGVVDSSALRAMIKHLRTVLAAPPGAPASLAADYADACRVIAGLEQNVRELRVALAAAPVSS